MPNSELPDRCAASLGPELGYDLGFLVLADMVGDLVRPLKLLVGPPKARRVRIEDQLCVLELKSKFGQAAQVEGRTDPSTDSEGCTDKESQRRHGLQGSVYLRLLVFLVQHCLYRVI